jgi:hypothetical protein
MFDFFKPRLSYRTESAHALRGAVKQARQFEDESHKSGNAAHENMWRRIADEISGELSRRVGGCA